MVKPKIKETLEKLRKGEIGTRKINIPKQKRAIRQEKANKQITKQIKKIGNSIAEQILNKWATAIVPKEAIYLKNNVAGVNQDKILHYEEEGYKIINSGR